MKIYFFKETDKSFSGAVYICSAGFVFTSLILAMYLHFSLGGKKISEVVVKEKTKIEKQKDEKKSSDTFELSVI